MRLPAWLKVVRRAVPEKREVAEASALPPDDVALVEAGIDRRAATATSALDDGDGEGAFATLAMRDRETLPAADEAAEALRRAERLTLRGHGAAAVPLLAPFAHGSARVALAHARAAVLADPAGAPAIWTAAHDYFPTPAVAAATATALADVGHTAEAFALLDAAIARDRRVGLRSARVRLLERVGSLGDAADAAQALAAEQPDDPALAREAARLAHDAGRRSASAVPDAEPAEAEGPAAARRRANRLIAQGRLAEAVSLLEHVVASRGEANDAVALVAAVLLAAEPVRGAALAADFAARWPGDARFPLKVAQVAERAGEVAAARQAFLRAVAIEPGNVWALTGVARMLIEERNYAAARGWLDACARGDEASPWPHAIRALAEVREGQVDDARAALDLAYARGASALASARCDEPAVGDPASRGALSAKLFDRFLGDLAASRSTLLIGNSPALLDQAHGPTIDAADCVIRLNDFRIAGFDAHVGHRTDWWFSSANRQAEPDAASVGTARAILTQPVPQHIPELPAFALGRLGLDLGPDRACFMPPVVHTLSDRTLYPGRTTGLRMILILEFLAQAPFRAIGFDFFASSALHYFHNGADRLTIGESHAVGFERAFVTEVLRPLARFGRYD